MGVVYLALGKIDQQPVAVKTIKPEGTPRPGQIERFLREANILRELSHRHIVAFQELGEAAGLIYLAMDYVAGSDAGRFLQERGRLTTPLAVRIIMQGLQALEYAHDRQFVHRDVKPANLLLETSRQHLRVKVADFGLARVYLASALSGLTLKNQTGGTLEFMSPEQITNFRDVQPAADQFSAAATLYTLLTGRCIRDLTGHLAARIEQILNSDLVPICQRRPDLNQKLAMVIHRALAREPRHRYPSVAHFRQALRPFATV
jgi:serine/threonine-protein kinase